MQNRSLRRGALGALAGGLILLIGARASATINYTYTQDFDSLPTSPENANLETQATPQKWADDTSPSTNVISIPGWYLYHPLSPSGTPAEVGTNGHQRFRVQSGQTGTGSFYSFGGGTNASVNPNTDRALGDVGSTTIASNSPGDQNIYTGLKLINNTADTLTDFTLTYTGEQWRNIGNANPHTISVAYSLDPAATINTGTYTAKPTMDFVSPIHTATAAALDGNLAANRQTLTTTVSGLNWTPGSALWLRWDDLQIGGNDHALAIDDVNFTATSVPEPASITLAGIATIPLLARRRRRI